MFVTVGTQRLSQHNRDCAKNIAVFCVPSHTEGRTGVAQRNVILASYFYSKTSQTHNFSNLFYFGTILYMFRTVSPSIIRSLRLYIQHQVYVIEVLWLLLSGNEMELGLASSHRTCMKYTWCCVYNIRLPMMDGKTETCRVFFYVLFTVHLSIILDNDQRDAHLLYFSICFLHSSTCFEHYMLIIRRMNCIDAVSGIVLSVQSSLPTCAPDGHWLGGRYQILHQYSSSSWRWAYNARNM